MVGVFDAVCMAVETQSHNTSINTRSIATRISLWLNLTSFPVVVFSIFLLIVSLLVMFYMRTLDWNLVTEECNAFLLLAEEV